MRFLVTYGSLSDVYEAIETSDLEDAVEYAWRMAKEDYESYEGYHGIRDWAQIAEEDFGYDPENCSDEELMEIDEAYNEEVENAINYHAEPFDIENDAHWQILENQDFRFYTI